MTRRTQSTCLTLLGAMVPFLLKAPPTPRDRDHPLKKVVLVPLSDASEVFAERFGVDVYTTFNMTETSWPLVSERNPQVRGTCGRPRDGIDARIVDDNDCEVAPGVVGELIVRSDIPWSMNHGYHNNPEATAAAWRNGWFHTGDAFRRDADGNFFFVDRLKDAIRRRGENISSFEVEAEVNAHPAVREAAAVGVPSEFGEDDVLAVVAPVAGKTIDPAELLAVPGAAHGALHGAALRPHHARAAQDADARRCRRTCCATKASRPTPGTARPPASASGASGCRPRDNARCSSSEQRHSSGARTPDRI